MAYGPTINTQFDGQRKLIYVFNIDGAMDGSAGTTTIDVSTLAKSCLLYTSPSPRDGLLSRMPSSA